MLRAWGAGLASDARDEVRAAGKAILLLIDEIDLLHVDLWNARAVPPSEDVPGGEGEPAAAEEKPAAGREPGLERSLRWRLAGFRHSRSPSD